MTELEEKRQLLYLDVKIDTSLRQRERERKREKSTISQRQSHQFLINPFLAEDRSEDHLYRIRRRCEQLHATARFGDLQRQIRSSGSKIAALGQIKCSSNRYRYEI